MKAKIMGTTIVTNEKFSYELENVVAVLQTLETITIQYIIDGKPQTAHYDKDSVKIVVEN